MPTADEVLAIAYHRSGTKKPTTAVSTSALPSYGLGRR